MNHNVQPPVFISSWFSAQSDRFLKPVTIINVIRCSFC